jgi:hypothetical protein
VCLWVRDKKVVGVFVRFRAPLQKDYLRKYYQEWLEIANDPTTHIGENLKINFHHLRQNTLEKELMDS